MATYETAVAEFRSLDESIESGQWRQAQLTWEQVQSGITRRQWAEAIGKGEHHVGVLYRVWDRWGKINSGRPQFNEAYQHAEKGDDWREIKDANRAASALNQLPPERKAATIAAAVNELEPDQQAQIVERMLEGDQGHKTRARIAPVIQRHDQRTERDLTHQRQRQVDDGQRPGFEATEAVARVIASGHQYLTDVAHLPTDLNERSRELLAHLATRMLPVVEWQAGLEDETSVSDAADAILRDMS